MQTIPPRTRRPRVPTPSSTGRANRLVNQLRQLAQPLTQPETYPPDSATVSVQLWLRQSIWRPTAGWAMICALLASGFLSSSLGSLWQNTNWHRLVLLWLLVDLLWGAIWRTAGGRAQLLTLRAGLGAGRPWLPYMQPDSPAALLFSWNEADVWPWLLRTVVPAVLVALVAAVPLGQSALLLTVIVAIITLLGWILHRTFERPPTLLHALVTLAAPWLLTLWQQGITPSHERWQLHLLLIALWVLHQWGAGRSICFERDAVAVMLLGLADLGLIALLVIQQTPLLVLVMMLAALPTWLSLIRQQPVRSLGFWWLVQMVVSALAVGA